MENYLKISVSDAPEKTFRTFNKLPVFCKHVIPHALKSHLRFEDIHIISQELPGWKCHLSGYTFLVTEYSNIQLSVSMSSTFFVASTIPGLTLRHPLYNPGVVSKNQATAMHLPEGNYDFSLKRGLYELFIFTMPYGLLVHESDRYPYLNTLCAHWKAHPQLIRLFKLGAVHPTPLAIPADFQERPEQIFQKFPKLNP